MSAYSRRMIVTFQVIAILLILILWWTDAIPAFVAGILVAAMIGAIIMTHRALSKRSSDS